MKALRFIVPGMRLLVDEDGANRRQSGRVHISGLVCDRGRVIDLSGTGARMETRLAWREGARRDMTLTGMNKRVKVAARCVWRRREGFMRYMIGVAFEELSAEQAKMLGELARGYSMIEAPRQAA